MVVRVVRCMSMGLSGRNENAGRFPPGTARNGSGTLSAQQWGRFAKVDSLAARG